MTDDWLEMDGAEDSSVEGSSVGVTLQDGRKHCVEVSIQANEPVLSAFVAKQTDGKTRVHCCADLEFNIDLPLDWRCQTPK
jgi:hypothetical protein